MKTGGIGIKNAELELKNSGLVLVIEFFVEY